MKSYNGLAASPCKRRPGRVIASPSCLGIIGTYARFVAGFYLSLGILWALLIAALLLVVGSRGLTGPSCSIQAPASNTRM